MAEGAETAGTERVLVVDDEPYITDLLSAALRFEGFEVEVAATGNEAIRKARSVRPDLVLLDVMLPDLDGFETCRRIRAVSDVPILMLTAKGEDTDRIVGLVTITPRTSPTSHPAARARSPKSASSQ